MKSTTMPNSFSPPATCFSTSPLPDGRDRAVGLQLLVEAHPSARLAVSVAAWISAAPDASGLGITTCPLVSGRSQVGPRLRLERRPGVVDDAGGDQLGGEPRLVLVVRAGRIGRDVRFRIGQQPAFALQVLHRHRVGDQQHVGLRLPGLHLGAQLRDDARRSVAHEGDVDLRMLRLEGVDRLLRVLVRLAGVETSLPCCACASGRRHDQHRGKQQADGEIMGKSASEVTDDRWSVDRPRYGARVPRGRKGPADAPPQVRRHARMRDRRGRSAPGDTDAERSVRNARAEISDDADGFNNSHTR